MIISINGEEQPAHLFTYNDHMNFGQRQRYEPSSLDSFQMVIPRVDFVARFSDLYEIARKDMLAEFKAYPKSFDESDGFFVMGFDTSLDEAFGYPSALADVIDTFLVWNHSNQEAGSPSCILDAYFRPGWQGKVVDGVDGVMVDARGVTLHGFLHRGRPVHKGG